MGWTSWHWKESQALHHSAPWLDVSSGQPDIRKREERDGVCPQDKEGEGSSASTEASRWLGPDHPQHHHQGKNQLLSHTVEHGARLCGSDGGWLYTHKYSRPQSHPPHRGPTGLPAACGDSQREAQHLRLRDAAEMQPWESHQRNSSPSAWRT